MDRRERRLIAETNAYGAKARYLFGNVKLEIVATGLAYLESKGASVLSHDMDRTIAYGMGFLAARDTLRMTGSFLMHAITYSELLDHREQLAADAAETADHAAEQETAQ